MPKFSRLGHGIETSALIELMFGNRKKNVSASFHLAQKFPNLPVAAR